MLHNNGLWREIGRRSLSITLAGSMLTTALPSFGEDSPAGSSKSVRISPALQSRVRDLIEEVSEAAVELDIDLDRPKLIRGKKDVVRILVSNPQIVRIEQIDGRDLEVIGKRPGSTSVTLWIGNDPRQTQVLQMMVVVKAAPGGVAPGTLRTSDSDEPINRGAGQERGGGTLEEAAREQFPKSQLRLLSAADKVLVHGTARDSQEASRIVKFVQHHVAAAAGSAGASNPDKVAETRVVNLLKVRTEPQVRLNVQRVEIPRTALRQFCDQFKIQFEQLSIPTAEKSAKHPSIATLDASAFRGYLKVLQTRKTVKTVEEPAILAKSGQVANLQIHATGNRGNVRTASHGQGAVIASLGLIPWVGEKGKIRLEVAGSDAEEIQPVSAGRSMAGRGAELKSGEALVITGITNDGNRGETASLIIVTPEIPSAQSSEAAPPLVPARGRKSAARQSSDQGADESRQRSLDYYISGPVGFSD